MSRSPESAAAAVTALKSTVAPGVPVWNSTAGPSGLPVIRYSSCRPSGVVMSEVSAGIGRWYGVEAMGGFAARLLYSARMAALADAALITLSTDETDPRARGLAAGSALAEPAALSLAAYLPMFASVGHDLDDVRRFGARVLERAASWHPPLALELEAFALGARLEPELVAALNGRTELLAFAECTTVGRCESAEGPWLAQNWDWYADDSAALPRVVGGRRGRPLRDDDRGRHPGQGRRLDARDRGRAQHPLPRARRPGRARRARAPRPASTAGGGREHRRGLGVAARDALLGLQLRHRGRCHAASGACFELSPAGVARIEPRDGLLAHTNHFLDGALAADEAEQPAAWLPGSRARLATAQSTAPRELGDALALLADHTSDPQPICRHAEDPGAPGRPLVDTVVSLAMRPGVPELRVAAGQPCECAFLPYEV